MTTRVTEMNAKITADTQNVLAGLERVKRATQDVGTVAKQAGSTSATAFDKVANSADKVGKATGAALNAIYALEANGSARVLALGNAVGNVAGLLGPAGKFVQGFAVVGSAIAALFLQAREQSAEAVKAISDDIASLVNAGDFASITKKLQQIDQGTAGNNFADGRAAIRQRIEALTQEASAVGKSSRYYRERFAQITAEKQALAELTTQFTQYSKALTSQTNAPRLGRSPLAISSTADSPEALARQAKEAAAQLKKLRELADETMREIDASTKKAADSARGLGNAYAEVNATLEAQNALTIKRLEARDDEADASKRSIRDAEAEIAALREGAEAYDTYLRKQAQDRAARVVLQKARDEGRNATAQELIDARTNAAYLYDAVQVAQQLQAALKDSGAGQLANELGEVAERATQIATSLGAAGKDVAFIAAIAGPLFKGTGSLQQGLVKRDANGNGIAGQSSGLIDALRGRNGKDSQAQTIAGALSVVGAVATIADAVDLFGTRARERAKQMREAAEAFNFALDEFVIRDRTSLESSLRDNLAKADALRKQAGEANGFTFTGGPLKSLDEFRAQIAGLTALGNSNAPVGVREQFLKLRDTLQELADKAEANAAKLRELNAAELSRLSDSLAVRRLAVNGLGDQADAERARLALLDEERELTAKFGPAAAAYIAELKEVTAAEFAAARATKARNEALSLLDDTLSILGGTKLQGLTTTIGTLQGLFPQLAGLFDGLDLSSAGGLTSATDRLRELFRTLSADGISEAERPIVDAIKRLLGSIEGAIGELVDPLTAALDVFSVRVEVFGLDVKAQFGLLADIFRNAFPEIGALLDANAGSDLATLKGSLQTRIAALLEGGISEGERPLLAALQQLLGTVVGQIDEAARAAEEAAQKAEEARQRRVSESERSGAADASLRGLTGNDALQARLATLSTLSPALAGLLPLSSDTSANGIRASKDALFALFRQLEDGTLPIEQFGDLTKDEIIDRILELNGNLDDLAGSLSDAAKAAAEASAAERQSTNDLRIRLAKARGEETRIAEFELAATRERDAAAAAGRSAAFLGFLDQVLASERTKLLADIAGAATSAAISEASSSAAEQSRSTGTTSRILGGVTDVSVQVQNGYLRLIADNTRASAQYSGLLLTALSGMRAPSTIPIPSIPSFGGSGGGGGNTYVINLGAPVITAPMVGAPADIGRQIGIAQGLAVQEALGRLLELDVRALGGRKR